MKTANKTYCCVTRNPFRTTAYTTLAGDRVLESMKPVPKEGFHVLESHDWNLTVQEQDDRGVWFEVYSKTYFRKSDAVADARRMGIDLDFVSHHADSVRSFVLGV